MERWMIGLTLCLGLAATPWVHAEYRAYELAIINQETGNERRVLSTFDHLQYPAFYPLARNEFAQYVTSWRCRGRTGGFRPICPNPQTTAAAPPTAAPKTNSTP